VLATAAGAPGRWTAPLSIVAPVRLMAWKYRSSPVISTIMKW